MPSNNVARKVLSGPFGSAKVRATTQFRVSVMVSVRVVKNCRDGRRGVEFNVSKSGLFRTVHRSLKNVTRFLKKSYVTDKINNKDQSFNSKKFYRLPTAHTSFKIQTNARQFSPESKLFFPRRERIYDSCCLCRCAVGCRPKCLKAPATSL